MTPDELEPQRNALGQYTKGQSGNPGGLPKRARLFRQGAAEASMVALELLTKRLVDARDNPTKVVHGPDGREWLEPTMADKDVIAAVKTLADYGGHMPPAEFARLLLQARNTGAIEKPEDWDKFASLVEPEYTAPVDAGEEPTP